MSQDFADYGDIPDLQAILNFLPIDPDDKEDINNYVKNITATVYTNYKNGHYQFAYFGVHLLYMTYIYCTAWKIGRIESQRYKDAVIFARSYSGREKELDIEEASSVFAYSLMPEKDIAKLFRIINLDKSRIAEVGNIVETRNDMAHASGKFEIISQETFEAKIHSILSSMRMIHKNMATLIKKWYSDILLQFCSGQYNDYSDQEFDDFIYEQMIQTFKISINELLLCNSMSLKKLIATNLGYKNKLRTLKNSLNVYCVEKGYTEDLSD